MPIVAKNLIMTSDYLYDLLDGNVATYALADYNKVGRMSDREVRCTLNINKKIDKQQEMAKRLKLKLIQKKLNR